MKLWLYLLNLQHLRDPNPHADTLFLLMCYERVGYIKLATKLEDYYMNGFSS